MHDQVISQMAPQHILDFDVQPGLMTSAGGYAPLFDELPREAAGLARVGDADPSAFGIFDMRGLWFIAGNLMRDFAALNNMELLPWDVWGNDPS